MLSEAKGKHLWIKNEILRVLRTLRMTFRDLLIGVRYASN